MSFDRQRHLMGTWGDFVEVPRRPVLAPGAKPMTKEQRELARRQHRQATRVKEMVKQGWTHDIAVDGWVFKGVVLGWNEVVDLEDDALAALVKQRAEELAERQLAAAAAEAKTAQIAEQVAKYQRQAENQRLLYGMPPTSGGGQLLTAPTVGWSSTVKLLGPQYNPMPTIGFPVWNECARYIPTVGWSSTVTSSSPYITATLTT